TLVCDRINDSLPDEVECQSGAFAPPLVNQWDFVKNFATFPVVDKSPAANWAYKYAANALDQYNLPGDSGMACYDPADGLLVGIHSAGTSFVENAATISKAGIGTQIGYFCDWVSYEIAPSTILVATAEASIDSDSTLDAGQIRKATSDDLVMLASLSSG